MVVLSCHVLCCFKKMSWRQGTLKGNVVHLDLWFLNLESPSLHGHICQAPHLDGVIWWGTHEGEAGQKCVETSHKKNVIALLLKVEPSQVHLHTSLLFGPNTFQLQYIGG